ncbi:hypothetical protein [Paenibacillus sp. FSL K6-1230]|uniref:hypothetical protein n=1 Tax=Paenibacillus sp. FSL K6-1230 TaxID=2921603 RepID=UPI0030F7B5D9
MSRHGFGDEHQNMIDQDVLDDHWLRAAEDKRHLPKIDVTARVMERIQHQQTSSYKVWRRLTTPIGAVIALCSMLLAGVSAYAAVEWIQIRDSTGEVKVEYTAPELRETETDEDIYNQYGRDSLIAASHIASYNKYEQQALAAAKPGELMAYYVTGKKELPLATSTVAASPQAAPQPALYFAYKERLYTEYDRFLQEMKRVSMPILPAQAGEYIFDVGRVSPRQNVYYTANADASNTVDVLARDTLAELMTKAHQAPDGKIFMKPIAWKEPGFFAGTYTSKRGGHIGISAAFVDKVQVYQEKGNSPEVIQVAGRSVIYNDVMTDRINTRNEQVTYHYLNWYNEEQDAYYTISTYGDHILDKAGLLELARELIEAGL